MSYTVICKKAPDYISKVTSDEVLISFITKGATLVTQNKVSFTSYIELIKRVASDLRARARLTRKT